MAGGTKRLPRAVREQQMLDAAVQIFSVNGYHETSMDAIAAEAEISKPMLYLYYGSKEELFGACLDRELNRFVDEVRNKIDFSQSPKELLRNAVLAFLKYIDANRASWMVLYTQATSSQAFAHTVREGRERIVDLVGRLLRSGTRHPEPDTDFDMMAVALVGAGEAVANRVSTGDADVDEAAELMINLFWRGLKGTPCRSACASRGDRLGLRWPTRRSRHSRGLVWRSLRMLRPVRGLILVLLVLGIVASALPYISARCVRTHDAGRCRRRQQVETSAGFGICAARWSPVRTACCVRWPARYRSRCFWRPGPTRCC